MPIALTEPDKSQRVLLRVVAGSCAHGTAEERSDEDVRTIYLATTADILAIKKLSKVERNPDWDENIWELFHAMDLACGGDPSVLEALLTPTIKSSSPEGEELRSLFPHFLSKKRVFTAFNKFAQAEKRTAQSLVSSRRIKARGSYLRVLYNAIELLERGTFTVRIVDTPIGSLVSEARRGSVSLEMVLEKGRQLEEQFSTAYASSILPERPNFAVLDEFLWRVRNSNWHSTQERTIT